MKTKRLLLLLIGLVCVGIGIFRGEAMEVMRKATMICFECIGLG